MPRFREVVTNMTTVFFQKGFWCKFGIKFEDWEPAPFVTDELSEYETQKMRRRLESK